MMALFRKVFLESDTLVSDLLGNFRGSYISDVPRFKGMTGDIFLAFRIAKDKTIISEYCIDFLIQIAGE